MEKFNVHFFSNNFNNLVYYDILSKLEIVTESNISYMYLIKYFEEFLKFNKKIQMPLLKTNQMKKIKAKAETLNFKNEKFLQLEKFLLYASKEILSQTTNMFYENQKSFFQDLENYLFKEIKYPLFKDVIGLEEAKKFIDDKVIKAKKYKDIYEKYELDFGGGILLYGLPGTGKTMFAKAVANEIDAEFISIKSSDLKDKYFGETEQKITELFKRAQKFETAIIFIDEFEALGSTRDNLNNLTSSIVVPQLLAEIEGYDDRKNIILLAATNRPWDIDSAFLRPGRFDQLIKVELPNLELREIMFKKYLKVINLDESLISFLAIKTKNYNGADIKYISDKIKLKIINQEILGLENYKITLEEMAEILKSTKSSISKNDLDQINKFSNSFDKGESI